jgi:hypothetical protein
MAKPKALSTASNPKPININIIPSKSLNKNEKQPNIKKILKYNKSNIIIILIILKSVVNNKPVIRKQNIDIEISKISLNEKLEIASSGARLLNCSVTTR